MIVGSCAIAIRKISLLLGFWVCISASIAMSVEEPVGYRMERYDDRVPETLAGATRVFAIDVLELQQNKAALVIDVIPEHRPPDDLPEGQLWLPVAHQGVAGALWLPDVGYGVLSEVTEAYFKSHLKEVSSGDWGWPLIFYCRSDCWMSWNAAKRAMSYGYTSVYWFADGIDDWIFEEFELEVLTPAEGMRQAVR